MEKCQALSHAEKWSGHACSVQLTAFSSDVLHYYFCVIPLDFLGRHLQRRFFTFSWDGQHCRDAAVVVSLAMPGTDISQKVK